MAIPAIPERYRAVRLLGEGGMGEVWEVEDTLGGADRPPAQALKVARSQWAVETEERFRAEFRTLALLRHPNLARVFDYGRLGDGRPYYTAELCAGRPLSESSGRIAIADACQVLAALCRVLDFLALRGLVHNDVKPSNVLLRADDPAGLKLLDFGLVALASETGAIAAGTPPYMAPERLRGGPADHRSDLYSLGVTVYRTLTGTLPYEGTRSSEIIAAMSEGYSPARVLRPDCPAGLEHVVGRLLALDASARPQRAAEVFDLLAEGGLPRLPRETPVTREAYALSGAFVGRDDELGALRRDADRAGQAKAPVLAVVRGPAGAGKSRLLAELRLRLQLDGRDIFAARAGRSAGPFAPVAEMARLALAAGRQVAGASTAFLSSLGPRDAPAAASGVSERARLALLGAQALAELGADRPFVAIVDDLDRADEGTVETLAALVRLAAAAPVPLWLVVGVRDERVDEPLGAQLEDWSTRAAVLTLPLAPLGRPALRRLLDSLFGGGVFGERAAERLLSRSAGSPLLVEELVRALLREGTLQATATGWSLGKEPATGPRAVDGALREVFVERVRALDGRAGAVARVLAVLVEPSDPALIARLAAPDLDEAALAAALGNLDAGGLLLHEAGRIALFHEAFGEALLAATADDTLRALHLRAAEALASAGAGEAVLARHYLAGADAVRGFPVALRAGLRARDLGDFAGALPLLEGAAASADAAAATAGDRLDLHEALGDVRAARGTAEDAGREYEQGLALAPDHGVEAARLCAKAAHAFVVRGDYDAASRWIERAGPDREPLAHPELERARLWLLLYRGQLAEAAARARARLEEIERVGDRPGAALLRPEVELVLGQTASWAGKLDEARAHLSAALAGARGSGDLIAEMTAELGLGMLATVTGQPRDAARYLERAVELCERTGNQRQLELAVTNLGATRAALGDYAAAEEHLRRIIARRRRAGGTPDYPLLKLGEVRTLRGDADEARALFEELLDAEPGRVPAWIRVEAALFLTLLGWATGVASRPRGENPWELARTLARQAGQGAGAFEAMAVSAEALALAARGDVDGALGQMAKARELYVAYGATLWVAGSQYAAAEILRRAGRLGEAARAFDEAARQLEGLGNQREAGRARRRMAEITAETSPDETMIAADLLRRCTDAARRIGGQLDRPAVMAALADAAADVLGARTVLVVQRGPQGPMLAASRGAGPSPLDDADVRTAIDAALEAPSARSGPGWMTASADAEGAPPIALWVSVAEGPLPTLPEVGALLVEAAAWALRATLLAEKVRAARRAVPDGVGSDPRTAAAAGSARRSQMLELTIGIPEVAARGPGKGIVGRSAPMKDLLGLLDKLSHVDIPILILGETGTGKELVARAIHNGGKHASGPFVAVNCAALAPALAESELFGHVCGAFTGAQRDRRGLFEEADGGTLFLDEIGEMGPALQAKLLRVVEDGVVRPLGATSRSGFRVDVRLVAATNRELADEVAAGGFRRDLYHRLSVMEVRLPPLRSRPSDVPLLVKHFLTAFRAEAGGGADRARVSADAMAALERYPWPGNVRELENELRRAWVLAAGEPIGLAHLTPRLRGETSRPRARPAIGTREASGRSNGSPGPASSPTVGDALRSRVAVTEREAIVEALRKASGHKARAAGMLGLSRPTLNAKIRRYGIPEPKARRT